MTAMDPLPAAPSPPAAGVPYDSRRGRYYVKPVLRGWLHLLWFEASLVLGTLLVARAHGAVQITALVIYAASVSALFGISVASKLYAFSVTSLLSTRQTRSPSPRI